MGFFQTINLNESVADKAALTESQTIVRGKKALAEHVDWKGRFSKLEAMMESADAAEAKRASITAQVMSNLSNLMEAQKSYYTEATFTSMLGPMAMLTPRVLDIVGVFYPNMIAHLITDIQVMDRSTGEIFVLRPRYGSDAAGVTAGQEMWVNPTDGSYASEYRSASANGGETDGTTTEFAVSGLTAEGGPMRRGSVTMKLAGVTVARDDAHGNMMGRDKEGHTISGTVDYEAGDITVEFSAAPSAGKSVLIDAYMDSEADPAMINEVNFDIQAVPVTARAHPLRYTVSAQATLVASAHLDVDVNEVLTNIAAGAIKQERDVSLVNMLVAAATHLESLDFDLEDATVNYRNKRDRFADIELKVNEAQTKIQSVAGRGGVSFVVAGANAANCFRLVEGFESAPEATNATVGPYKMGAIRNGTVPVICVPISRTLGANDFIIGFRGFQAGDSATVLAEWIPLYFTPLFEAPNLQNKRGLMSLYDMLTNRPEYLVSGKVKGYKA